MKPQQCWVEGWALWAASLPGWDAAAPALRGGPLPAPAAQRPAPALLAANERRRAPDSVLLALEVAAAALAMAGRSAADVATVFASTHGDLPITDALCKTLAGDPRLLSPTRFHHSVHNAASGYWAMGSGSHAASTALAAGPHTFAAGLLEAATQCAADQQAVMLVAYDTEATGALLSVNASRGLLAVALLLVPESTAPHARALGWRVQQAALPQATASSRAAATLADNASAAALPFFEALAQGRAVQQAWPLSATSALVLELGDPSSGKPGPAAA